MAGRIVPPAPSALAVTLRDGRTLAYPAVIGIEVSGGRLFVLAGRRPVARFKVAEVARWTWQQGWPARIEAAA